MYAAVVKSESLSDDRTTVPSVRDLFVIASRGYMRPSKLSAITGGTCTDRDQVWIVRCAGVGVNKNGHATQMVASLTRYPSPCQGRRHYKCDRYTCSWRGGSEYHTHASRTMGNPTRWDRVGSSRRHFLRSNDQVISVAHIVEHIKLTNYSNSFGLIQGKGISLVL